ncbi:Formyltransferase/hydrolase complex Fhc subunit B [Methylobacterium crusticola]|uniref:Formyltransferase/hydrolase complex Fhc subunit B n=1 Tax=Methylobacterium crusticola TaxID=1697972 RepID=A0ABQ4R4M1_9HYPH|nr:formyltransferase [Methylobacterium crusticola]GJD52070.1 Formyltransferase/hydrolase complex Fhc subunit B [Methylobacterium crusticola]
MTAWIDGRAADPDAAVAAAASLLAGARAPVIAGLCAEVAAVRAAYRLARRLGASLDPVAGPALYADLAALAAGGAMTTTPAEALGRAETVLAVGARPWDSALLAALAAGGPQRGRAAGRPRALLALGGPVPGGPAPDGPAPGGAGQPGAAVAYPAGEGGLGPAIGLLRGLAAGRVAGPHALSDLADRLRAALYGVVLYDPAEIGALAVEMLNGLVRDVSETTRCFALSLGDPHQGSAVAQVSAWTTGQAPRVGFGRGRPEHDPWRFDSARQAASGEVDAALWLATLPVPRPSWIRALPTVALLGRAAGDEAAVVIAVGVPGEGVGGALWHPGRAAIAWQPAARAGPVPPAADVLGALHDRIPASPESPASC